MKVLGALVLLAVFGSIKCPYTPMSDEVTPGNVLLPATRRGRYLANIIRRQAVDGTGIHFNRDADRINAEAKKKVDVLSDELLPYIIAEQDRRVTLHKRVMTAIQNGEKGVTVAELRGKPPALIRRGKIYRCPANVPPKEPDGSGTVKCENGKDATEIIYDSCLSAEDRELFNVAETNKYYFCNRRDPDEPDDSRNGTMVIGCPPAERTSYDYTIYKCALLDTDDVVVHYRYYPDRSYKYVADMDPEREVCENWNPCQIGYMFSLPRQELATVATEVFHYEKIVPGEATVTDNGIRVWVAKDQLKFYPPDVITLPEIEGGKLVNITKEPHFQDKELLLEKAKHYIEIVPDKKIIINCKNFENEKAEKDILQCYGTYKANYQVTDKDNNVTERQFKLYELDATKNSLRVSTNKMVPGQVMEKTIVPYSCSECKTHGITVRKEDDSLSPFDSSRFSNIKTNSNGKEQQFYEVDLNRIHPKMYGEYFVHSISPDGVEEFIKIASGKKDTTTDPPLTEKVNVAEPANLTGKYGEEFKMENFAYSCKAGKCKVDDVFCNAVSILRPKESIMLVNKTTFQLNMKTDYFKPEYACVLIAVVKYERDAADPWLAFDPKQKINTGYKVIGVIQNIKMKKTVKRNTHMRGTDFDQEVFFVCDPCDRVDNVTQVVNVSVNGMLLDKREISSRAKVSGSYYKFDQHTMSISVHVSPFTKDYEGVYTVWFKLQKNCDVCDAVKTIFSIAETGNGPKDEDATIPTPLNFEAEEKKPVEQSVTAAVAGSCTADPAKTGDGCEVVDVLCHQKSVAETMDEGVVLVKDKLKITFKIPSYDTTKYGMCVYMAVFTNGQQKPIGGFEMSDDPNTHKVLKVTADDATTATEGTLLNITTITYTGKSLSERSLTKVWSPYHESITKDSKDPEERTFVVKEDTATPGTFQVFLTIPKPELVIDLGPYYGLFKNHITGKFWVKKIAGVATIAAKAKAAAPAAG